MKGAADNPSEIHAPQSPWRHRTSGSKKPSMLRALHEQVEMPKNSIAALLVV